MRPAVRHVTTCLPCGWREAVRPGNSYAPRCENCGGHVELRTVAIDTLQELRAIDRDGSRIRVPRPRVVLMRAPCAHEWIDMTVLGETDEVCSSCGKHRPRRLPFVSL